MSRTTSNLFFFATFFLVVVPLMHAMETDEVGDKVVEFANIKDSSEKDEPKKKEAVQPEKAEDKKAKELEKVPEPEQPEEEIPVEIQQEDDQAEVTDEDKQDESINQEDVQASEAPVAQEEQKALPEKTDLGVNKVNDQQLPAADNEQINPVVTKPVKPIELPLDVLATSDGERLNWLAVREWFEHAEDKIKDMSSLLVKIMHAREQYIKTHDALDDKLEKAFVAIGFEQGKLTELLEYLLAQMEKERKDQGDLSVQERAFVSKLESKKNELQKLKDDLNALQELNDAADAVVKRVIEQITKSGEYNKKALEYFDQIPQGTIQAKEGFYHIDALEKSMQAVYDYVNGQLLQYFQSVVQKTEALLSSLEQQISVFKKDGIDLQHEVDLLEEQEIKAEEEKKKGAAQAREQEQIAQKKYEQEEQLGFMGKIWHAVRSFFISIYNRFFGAS